MSQTTPINTQSILLNPIKSKKPKKEIILLNPTKSKTITLSFRPRKPFGIYFENHFNLLKHYEANGENFFITRGIIVGSNLEIPDFFETIKPLK